MADNEKKEVKQALSAVQQLSDFEGLSQLVSRFSDSMRARLWEKADEGCEGWSEPSKSELEQIREKLKVTVEKYFKGERHQLVDIANLAAILWLHEGKATHYSG